MNPKADFWAEYKSHPHQHRAVDRIDLDLVFDASHLNWPAMVLSVASIQYFVVYPLCLHCDLKKKNKTKQMRIIKKSYNIFKCETCIQNIHYSAAGFNCSTSATNGVIIGRLFFLLYFLGFGFISTAAEYC